MFILCFFFSLQQELLTQVEKDTPKPKIEKEKPKVEPEIPKKEDTPKAVTPAPSPSKKSGKLLCSLYVQLLLRLSEATFRFMLGWI